MKSIKTLLEKYGRVWFYVSDEYKKDFYEELKSLDAKFINGEEITEDKLSNLMGLRENGTLGYISYFVWYHSFNVSNTPIKINYGKYYCNEANYFIIESKV